MSYIIALNFLAEPLFLSLPSGGPFPAAGQHIETLQATLQAADQARPEQGPAGRGNSASWECRSGARCLGRYLLSECVQVKWGHSDVITEINVQVDLGF